MSIISSGVVDDDAVEQSPDDGRVRPSGMYFSRLSVFLRKFSRMTHLVLKRREATPMAAWQATCEIQMRRVLLLGKRGAFCVRVAEVTSFDRHHSTRKFRPNSDQFCFSTVI